MPAYSNAQSASLNEFLTRGRNFGSDAGKGVPIKTSYPFANFVLSKLVRKAEIINGKALLPTQGRPVVAIASHGPNIAWLPLAALAGKFFVDSGYGDIVGGFVPHKAVFLVPGLKGFYKRVLGSPTEVNTMAELVRLLKNHEMGITGTAPEGANCLLAFDQYVAPFRSKGMIAAAIQADASICLLAHQGAEDWNMQISLPFDWTVPFTDGLRGINIPLPPYKKIDRYMVLCKRYKPAISSRDIKGKTREQVRMLLNIEIEKIRAEMNLMTDKLKERMQKEKPTKKVQASAAPNRGRNRASLSRQN